MTIYLTLDNTPYFGGGQVILNELREQEDPTEILLCPPGLLSVEAKKIAQVIEIEKAVGFVRRAKNIRKAITKVAGNEPFTLQIHGVTALPLGVLATLGMKQSTREYTEHLYTKQYSLPDHTRSAIQVLMYRLLLGFVSHIYCVSKAVQSFLVDDLHISKAKTSVKYNPVSQIRKQSLYARGEILRIASIGSLTFVKNFSLLLNIVATLTPTIPLELTIIGDGIERESLKKQAAELGITQNVKFLLNIPHGEVIDELVKQDIYVQTSISESFGYAITEAMAVGLPCVAFSVGGIPEIIDDDLSGLLIPPYNAELFASAIRKLSADVELRRILGLNGKRSLEKFR
jgi:glycosyltransferase involved in cell wall biosynthesis